MPKTYRLFREGELLTLDEGLFPPEDPKPRLNDTLLIQYDEPPYWSAHRWKCGLAGEYNWFPLPKETIAEFRALLLLQQ